MVLPLFQSKLSAQDVLKVIEVSQRLAINPNWLLAVMYFETGGTLSPAKKNSIGSVGLIQFTRDKKGDEFKVIAGQKFFFSTLAKMSFIQ